MNYYTMTDSAIAAELGQRIRALRLRNDVTQQQLAQATSLSLNSIKSLESGRGKLTTLIAVLRELGALRDLDSFIPEPAISPLQLVRLRGKSRQRASGRRHTVREDSTEW